MKRIPKTMRVEVIFNEEEVNQCKTLQDVDVLFAEKSRIALGNLRIDMKKAMNEREKCFGSL